ncbi:sarcoplasmic calcium-binding protein [Agrilus planipennis]|uniref:Sarcoplasmic calcium-binding protein n=1 Tax=Agrilus planipennis TaxID=224129 RepID=A0A7F5R5W8_AGRPL|nr:sarcoplasmic calcium-binding protein [Agrilus planipennis]
MALSILRYGARCSLNGIEKCTPASFTALKNNIEQKSGRPSCDGSPNSKPNNTIPSLLVKKQQQHQVRFYSKSLGTRTEAKHKTDSDYSSESDVERRGHRGQTELWRRKMRTFHGILDVNKDGVISFDDFQLLSNRFIDLGHLSDKSTQEFRQSIRNLWEKLWGEITPYNLITVEKYLEDMQHVVNDGDLRKKAHGFLPFLFKAVDKDKSGEITVEEFKLFFSCLGLKEEDAIFSFRIIDTNGDGRINIKEFVNHGRRFFITEDEQCISKYFWGPLIEQ